MSWRSPDGELHGDDEANGGRCVNVDNPGPQTEGGRLKCLL